MRWKACKKGERWRFRPLKTDPRNPFPPDSARSRLEAVEDLRKRGLISEKEAEEKRKEILKGL